MAALLLLIISITSTSRRIIGMSTFLDMPPLQHPEINSTSPFCDSHHICHKSDGINVTVHPGECFCDDLCPIYNDCCHGYVDVSDTGEDIRKVVTSSTCVRFNEELMHRVDRCSPEYPTNDISRLCGGIPNMDDILRLIPVSEPKYGVTFKNIYCALCNEISHHDVLFWRAEVGCRMQKNNIQVSEYIQDTLFENDIENATFNNVTEKCINKMYRYELPLNIPPPRPCKRMINTCDDGWNDFEKQKKCRNGPQAVVYGFTVVYRNIYCAICNTIPISMCMEPEPSVVALAVAPQPPLMSVSILLDLNSNTMTSNGLSRIMNARSCDADSIYDPSTDICRRVLCWPDYVLKEHQCVKVPVPQISNGNWHVQQHMLPNWTREERCPLVKYDVFSYTILTNGSLYINDTGDTHGPDNYTIINDTLYICQHHLGDEHTYDKNYRLEIMKGVVSLIGHVVSVSSLLILICFYSWIKSLRTLPGKCLLCLACSLATAQLTFTVGAFASEVHILCVILAITTHFSYLMSFFWMNAMAFDVYITFRNQFITASSSEKKFVTYVLYSTLSPLCIILLALLGEYTDIPMTKPFYGRPFCWIGHRDALMYFFTVPIGALLCMNIMFFLLASYHVSQASGNNRLHKRPHAKRKRLLLYAKLSTIMGLTWIFAYIALITDLAVFWYLFIIFNSLQGLFISLAFLCNHKVFRIVKQKLGSHKNQTVTAITRLSGSNKSESREQKHLSKLPMEDISSNLQTKNSERVTIEEKL